MCCTKAVYILNHRIGNWAETEGVIPDQQHGFRYNRSTITAIKLLNQYVSEDLATPKTPLYVIFVDFKNAFDSVNRSIMLCKLKEVGLPGKVIRAIWPIIRENFVQITTDECLSNSVTQNVGLAQGECLSPLLYSILDGYPASLGFPIMHRVHVICIHPCHNCHDIK